MKKVLLTDKAKSDIKEINSFIANDNLKASNEFIDILKKHFSMLAQYPDVGVKKQGVIDKSVLIYTIKKKYSVVYRINGDNIEILRVLSRYQNIFAVL